MSRHYDGIPAGAVGEFLDRQGLSGWKRGANGWLNLQVLALPLVPAPACACAGAPGRARPRGRDRQSQRSRRSA